MIRLVIVLALVIGGPIMAFAEASVNDKCEAKVGVVRRIAASLGLRARRLFRGDTVPIKETSIAIHSERLEDLAATWAIREHRDPAFKDFPDVEEFKDASGRPLHDAVNFILSVPNWTDLTTNQLRQLVRINFILSTWSAQELSALAKYARRKKLTQTDLDFYQRLFPDRGQLGISTLRSFFSE